MEDRAAQDLGLVRAVLAGDSAAFGALVARYQGLVAGLAWRYGAGRDEIEDLVSEVFIKVYQNLHRYRPDHPFATWLYRVAANHVLDLARRARRERRRVEIPESLEDPAPGAEQRLQARERAAQLREALSRLGERYRRVLFLVYVEGLTVEEAARLLETPAGTIKTRLMRGRAALRKQLELARSPWRRLGG